MPGVITTTPVMEERYGLGNIAERWPDLRILWKGPEINLAADKSRAIVPFKVKWADRFRLASELIGWPFWDAEHVGKRHLPEWYRSWEWAEFKQGDPEAGAPVPVMHCTQILSIKGIGDGAQDPDVAAAGIPYFPEPAYEWAIIETLFETTAYNIKLRKDMVIDDDRPGELQRYIIKTEVSGGRYLVFEWGQWRLKYDKGDGTILRTERLARQVPFYEPFKTIRWEWLDVLPQFINKPRIDSMLGQTNDKVFDTYGAQTLLFQKFDPHPTMTPLGVRTFRCMVEALYFPSGVNRAKPPHPTQQAASHDGYWDIVDYDTESVRPYRATNFANIFRP